MMMLKCSKRGGNYHDRKEREGISFSRERTEF